MSKLLLPSRKIARIRTRDGLQTYDQRTIDSTGAFLIGELERLDQELHGPLVEFTWSRDIDLREDVTVADEVSSFTNSSFAAAGGINPKGKAWVGKTADAIASMQLDIGKTPQPLTLWGMELSYTLPELMSAQQLGRAVDQQKYEGIQLKWNMDVDEMVYNGDADLGYAGLLNNASVIKNNAAATGSSSSTHWVDKSPANILADVNTLITNVWTQSAWAVKPNRILLPPAQYGSIATQTVSSAGNISILKYVLENNVATQSGEKLEILPVKWAIGQASGGTVGTIDGHDRMVAYRKEKRRIRFPLTLLQRTPLEYRSLFQMTTYWGRLGVVEFVYPETVGYLDLI